MAKLILVNASENFRQEVPFDRPKISIGRKPGNELQFNRAEISGSHAAFLMEGGQYYISDLGSTNGTLLNGSPITAKERYPLQDGDVVTIAPFVITFTADQPEPSVQDLRKSGSGTMVDIASRVATGTAEYEAEEVQQAIDQAKQAATAAPQAPQAPPPKAAPAAPPPQPPARPEPVAPPPKPQETKAPEPPPAPVPVPKSRPASPPPAVEVPPPAMAAPPPPRRAAEPEPFIALPDVSAVMDYMLMAFGGIVLLAALGLIALMLTQM